MENHVALTAEQSREDRSSTAAHRKVQLWLRKDQAECVDSALRYLSHNCSERVRLNKTPDALDDFSHRRCIERMNEVRAVIAKATGRPS